VPGIPAHGRQRREDCEFQANLGYIAGSFLKKEKNNIHPNKVYFYKISF
jgi:hypothetical protein